MCGRNLQLVQLVGRFGVFFLSHTAPWFHLWFYFHLCIWVLPWGLLLWLPWRARVCPMRATCGGGAAAWVAVVLAAPDTQGSWRRGQQETQCSRRAWQRYWPTYSSVLAWRAPSLTEKPGRPQATGLQRVGHDRRDPACRDARLLSPVAALPCEG